MEKVGREVDVVNLRRKRRTDRTTPVPKPIPVFTMALLTEKDERRRE